jgi:hypothetical protein
VSLEREKETLSNRKKMAYRKLGFSQTELADRWEQESDSLDTEQLEARYGRPPYDFLGESRAPFLPSYSNLKAPLYVDLQGRLYYQLENEESSTRMAVKLPIRVQREEAKANSASYGEFVDFPSEGEKVSLSTVPAITRQLAGKTAKGFKVTVASLFVPKGRPASAEVEFSVPVPMRSGLDIAAIAQEVVEKEVDREIRKRERKEGYSRPRANLAVRAAFID